MTDCFALLTFSAKARLADSISARRASTLHPFYTCKPGVNQTPEWFVFVVVFEMSCFFVQVDAIPINSKISYLCLSKGHFTVLTFNLLHKHGNTPTSDSSTCNHSRGEQVTEALIRGVIGARKVITGM